MNTVRLLIASCLVTASLVSAGVARADIPIADIVFTCDGDSLKFKRTCSHSVGPGASPCQTPATGDPVYGCSGDGNPRVELGTISSYNTTNTESFTDPGGTQKSRSEGEGSIDTPCSTLHGYDELCMSATCGSHNGCGPVPENLPAAAPEAGSTGCATRPARSGIAAGFGVVFGLALLMAGLRRKNTRP